jgi:hypothetical protein
MTFTDNGPADCEGSGPGEQSHHSENPPTRAKLKRVGMRDGLFSVNVTKSVALYGVLPSFVQQVLPENDS